MVFRYRSANKERTVEEKEEKEKGKGGIPFSQREKKKGSEKAFIGGKVSGGGEKKKSIYICGKKEGERPSDSPLKSLPSAKGKRRQEDASSTLSQERKDGFALPRRTAETERRRLSYGGGEGEKKKIGNP